MVATVADHVLWKQCYVAIIKAANDIRNEAENTANHASRLKWAQEAEQDCEEKVNEMKYRVLQNASIAAAPTTSSDSDVQWVINSLIDSFATG